MILLHIGLLALSFYLLAVITDEFFVDSLEVISSKFKLSPEMTGATFMAIGSSAPEFFTALLAVFRTDSSANLGASTIVGSAIFNVLVIIGASSLFATAKLTWQPVIRDLMFYCIAIILLLVSFSDGVVTLYEAVSFFLFYIVYIFLVSKWQRWLRYKTPRIEEEETLSTNKHFIIRYTSIFLNIFIPKASEKKNKYILTFLISIIFIALLSHTLVESAAHVGHYFDINPTILGLTVLAAGTSIPDLLSSIIVARKGKGDMAVSNAVGSNIFDILFGLGVPWIILFIVKGQSEIEVDNDNLIASVFLLFATVLAVFTLLVLRKWKLGPKAGVILLFAYAAYIVYTVSQVI